MKIKWPALTITLMALFIQGCQLGDEASTEEEVATDVSRSTNSEVEVINRSDLYRFIVTGDGNFYELEGDLSAIVVTGNDNQISILDDSQLDSLAVTGEGNLISIGTGIATRIDDVIVLGDGHRIDITEYINLDADSATNLNLTGTQVTP